MAVHPASHTEVTAIVLCGGKGSRLDDYDKPLLQLGETRFIDRILDRLKSQVRDIVISCSRNVAIYEALHYPLAIDRELNVGPLGGLTEAFSLIKTEWAFTTPGDTPFISDTIVERLRQDAEMRGVAVPEVKGTRQNLCLLLDALHRDKLVEFHVRGGNAVKHWLNEEQIKSTDLSDIEDSFFNVNTHEDLTVAQSRISG